MSQIQSKSDVIRCVKTVQSFDYIPEYVFLGEILRILKQHNLLIAIENR